MSTQITTPPKQLWFNVGEASGDQHGAILIREVLKLNPDVQCIGMGGQAMFDAGMTTLIRSEELSVMGLTEVFGRIPKILSFLRHIRWELSNFGLWPWCSSMPRPSTSGWHALPMTLASP